MNYKETLEYISEISRFGISPGLSRIERFLSELGNPQDSLSFVHVSGTNGKGSVIAFVLSVLECAGYRVGVYTSPAVFEYRERFSIGKKIIGKVALAQLFTRLRQAADTITREQGEAPTLFEMETALAFLYFAEKKCDIAVIETGMGGTYDATNVIKNTISAVITSVSIDHTAYLGESLYDIATHKAGIIKKGCDVITLRQEESVIRAICESADEGNKIIYIDEIKKPHDSLAGQTFSYKEYKNIKISMLGSYQQQNAALAIETIESLRHRGYKISDDSLKEGLFEARWLGRFSVISKSPMFIIDGAHNEDGARRLAQSIEYYFKNGALKNRSLIYIIGVLKDKDYERIIEHTAYLADQIITLTIRGTDRALHAYELAKAVREYNANVTVADSVTEAAEMSYLLADKRSVIVAFGSLMFLGDLIKEVTNYDR